MTYVVHEKTMTPRSCLRWKPTDEGITNQYEYEQTLDVSAGTLNLTAVDDRYDLRVALQMFTRRIIILHRVEDLQLEVKSYQKKLNITKPETLRSDIPNITPYTGYKNPQGIIYQDKFQRNRLMRSDELYMFCDRTLLSVRAPELEDLPRDNPLDSVEVLRYEKRSKRENKGKVPTQMELVIEQTQQGTSYEVSCKSWQWDLYSTGSGNTLHWQWELILPVGTLSWQWECLVHFIPNTTNPHKARKFLAINRSLHSRLASDQSSNPTSSTNLNPKGRNHGRSKQRVENSNLKEHSHPVATMADQRTMAQLLQAPTEGYEDAIVVPAITADNFELKHGLLTLVQNKQFYGHDKEDPHAHIRYFNKITSTLKFPKVPNTSLSLCFFHFPSKSCNEIISFQQRFDETFNEAWDRFKVFFEPVPIMVTFWIKCPVCLSIIESKSKVCYSHDKLVVAKVSTNASTSGVSPDVAKLKHMVKALLLDKKGQNQSPAPVKAVEESCVTCGGAHSYRICPATDGNVYRNNIQEYVSQAFALNYNQENTSYRPQIMSNQFRPPCFPPVPNNQNVQRNNQNRFIPNQNRGNNFIQRLVYQPSVFQQLAYQAPAYPAPAPQTQGVSKDDFSAYVKANDVLVNSNTASTSSSSTLPSNTIANPKSDLKAITTQSSVSNDGPQILPPVVENEPEAIMDTVNPTNNENIKDVQYQAVQSKPIFKDMSFEISLADALILMPKFAYTLKALIGNKEKLSEMARPPLNEHCFVVLPKKLPEKLGDLGKFLIPCDFLGMAECLALADLGASINLMPLFVWKKLSLPDLTPTRMTLELSDRSISYPVGVAEDVYVKVGSFHFSADFVVVDFDADPRVPLILRRSFLKTRRALIDVFEEGDILLLDSFLNDDPSSPPPNQRNYMPEVRKELKICKVKPINLQLMNPPVVELKALPPHLEYAFLEGDDKLSVIIAKDLSVEEKTALIMVLKSHKRAIALKLSDIKGGFIVVENEDNELIPTRLVMGWRVCIDYRKLNESTRKDHFPLPFMDQMLERLAGNQYYCFLDGFSGYFQILINPKDQEKTTFTCPYETFAYRRMPLGLCNAPGTFQRCMMAIFLDMIEKTIEVFMDDFSVFGNLFLSCLIHLEKMLMRYEDTSLCLNWETSHFMVKEGIVLGHKVSKKGIEVDKAKVDVISKLPHPTTVKGIRSFLGHAGFYRRFIKDFSKTAKPMTRLLEKDTQFIFSQDDFAIGAVLGQCQDKHFKPIHYAIKTMTEAESNYTTTEKEMLAVVYAFEKFRSYLILNKIIVYTDHSALQYLFTKKYSKVRLLRWVLLIQEFTFKVVDTKAAENLTADHLSRLENLHQNVLYPKEFNESFPLETLNLVSTHGPFPSSRGNKYILIAVDYLSRWVEAKALPTNDDRVVCKFLKNLFARFGAPRAIISDRGTHFCNDQFTKVMQKYDVTHRLATPYHPQISGQVEVSNRGLKRTLEREVGENRTSWLDKLDDALWAFRTNYKTPIGCTPYKLVYGKACHLPVELEHKAYWALKHANFNLKATGNHRKIQINELNELRDQAYENSLIYKEKTKRIHDSKIKNRVFNIGDGVLLYNSRLKIFCGKLKSHWSGPFTISQVFPYGTVELSQPDRPNFNVNGHHFKHYFGEDIPQSVVPDL
nr:reverse transcriptase domain-containing protein [Tanacetum cinerariifolium]